MALSSLKKVLNDMAKTITEEIAQSVSEELVKVTEGAVAEFYEQYTPKDYVRTHQLYKAYEPYKKISKGIAHAGVYINSSRMNQNYRIDKSNVLDLSLGQGIHGLPGWLGKQGVYHEAIIYQPSTVMKIKKYRDEKLDLQKHFNSAYAKAAVKHRQEISNL